MRAICGAIVAAGAAIGLGLTALAFGTRYAGTIMLDRDSDGKLRQLHLHDMDTPLVFSLIFLACVVVIGLGICFLGLAYHHQRRHHELLALRERGGAPLGHHTPV